MCLGDIERLCGVLSVFRDILRVLYGVLGLNLSVLWCVSVLDVFGVIWVYIGCFK